MLMSIVGILPSEGIVLIVIVSISSISWESVRLGTVAAWLIVEEGALNAKITHICIEGSAIRMRRAA